MTEESKLVCHKGYISIFPLLLGLVPADSPHFGALLDMMSDPAHLWSEYGLRSLSKSDQFYSTGENYWRGPIWINMNYLALSSLHKVSPTHPCHSSLHRTIFPLRDHIKRRRRNCTMRYGRMWWRMWSRNGNERGLHGNNMIRKRVRVKEVIHSMDGQGLVHY